MKKIKILSFLIAVVIIIIYSCNKEENSIPPEVITASVDSIYNTTARVGGNVASDGGSEITERGVYWGLSSNPETSGTKKAIGNGTGAYYATLTGLVKGTKYYVKAYAQNGKGITYGNETFFTTQINLPTVTSSSVTDLSPSTAKIGGNVSDNGGFEVSERGIYWSPSPNPMLTGLKVLLGSGNGAFSYSLTELSKAVTYYYVAFATNIKGTAYGEVVSFTTIPVLATVYTKSAYKIKPYSAYVGGTISSNGGSEITERGIYWGTSPNTESTGTKRTIGIGNGSFVDSIKTLSPGVKYYSKAYAINSLGVSYGAEVSFTTLGEKPSAATQKASVIKTNEVTLTGIIDNNDLTTTVTFEYGTTNSYGNTVTAVGSPLSVADTLSATLTGLTPSTTYHFRVVAQNELGATYGADSIFKTVITGIAGTVSDNSGNSYSTIGIGYQEWMVDNLKTTKLNDGTAITLVDKDTLWAKLATPAYCWYSNDINNKTAYGAIYNWYTVNSNKLCPSGWRVPSMSDYETLIGYVGGFVKAGGMLKETGISHWFSPNTGATNQFLFKALPGGKRNENGIFDFMQTEGNWWTSSNYSTLTASYLNMVFNSSMSLQGYINKKNGMSVRCVKN